jgi:segregation and condensation protein B
MDRNEQRRIVEALILASPDPVSAARLAEIVPECAPGEAKDLVNELNTEYQEHDRSFEIWEVAGGYQIRTRAEFSGYLQQLQKQRPLRLSRAALDSLSIVAYKQPVTRAEIEQIRGVDAGAVLKGLLDRRLIRIAGQREVPGRPMLYATTRRFLEVFGLESLKSLPGLRELRDLASQKGVVLPGADDVEEREGRGEGAAEVAPDETAAAPLFAGVLATGAADDAEAADEGSDSGADAAEGDDTVGAAGDELDDEGGHSFSVPALSDPALDDDLDFEEDDLEEDGDAWQPPEIVEPEEER